MSWRTVKVSDHFSLGEFACEGETCCCHGAVKINQRLVHVVEEFRMLTGGPVTVTSGYRCDSYNKSVGGHVASFHRVGLAADLTSFTIRQDLEGWAEKAAQIIVGRYGDEVGNVMWYQDNGFIHIDVGHRISELVRKKETRGRASRPGQ